MSRTESSSSPESHNVGASSKRKRDIIPADEDEKLEIDVNLPEPPSKKAKRKEKKQAHRKPTTSVAVDTEISTETVASKSEDETASSIKPITTAPKRSDHAVWIGNLPFSVSKDTLRQFFKDKGGVSEQDITRVHLPTGEKGKNKGFAYVDVTTPSVLQIALSLSEEMIGGRRVLIKDAKSFEGRPDKVANVDEKGEATGNVDSKKAPSKRIFVGNLGFDVTKNELADHFSQAGPVEEVFMATFQDTGKCKGYGWIRFETIEAAESAVRGFIRQSQNQDESESRGDVSANEDSTDAKPQKPTKHRKHFINRIQGRTLRCEFAEDPQTRYKKRFGQKPMSSNDGDRNHPSGENAAGNVPFNRNQRPRYEKLDKEGRREERRKRHDARTIAPGKALAGAQRATGAIVASSGNKVVFD